MHRRKLLKLMALALVGCRGGGYAQEKGQIPSSRILVIGAGLAGLAAAWELHRQGYAVQVIEAQNASGTGNSPGETVIFCRGSNPP